MAFHDWGNLPVKSTDVSVANPDTATLVAELTPAQLAAVSTRANVPYRVNWRVGASTGAIFLLEVATSTGLGSTAIRESCMVFTGSNQTAQYLDHYRVQPGDRLRVRVGSSFTGTAAAQISAEPLT
jgi:hypothetical protein